MQYIFILEFCVFLSLGKCEQFQYIQNFMQIYIFGHTVHSILVLLFMTYNTWKKYTIKFCYIVWYLEYIVEICYLKESYSESILWKKQKQKNCTLRDSKTCVKTLDQRVEILGF